MTLLNLFLISLPKLNYCVSFTCEYSDSVRIVYRSQTQSHNKNYHDTSRGFLPLTINGTTVESIFYSIDLQISLSQNVNT